MQNPPNITAWYQQRFDSFERRLNGRLDSEFHSLRRKAMERFRQQGFPTRQDEEWRFTNIDAIAHAEFSPADPGGSDAVVPDHVRDFLVPSAARLAFVNGHYSPKLSSHSELPDGVEIISLAEAVRRNRDEVTRLVVAASREDNGGFVALNTAFLQDGAFIRIGAGIQLRESIHLLFVSAPSSGLTISNPRVMVNVGRGSEISLVETYASRNASSYLTNVVTEMVIDRDATVSHAQVIVEGDEGYHIGATRVSQNRNSRYTSHVFAVGGAIVRNTLNVRLAGEESSATLNGLTLASDEQLIDNHTSIEHAASHCESHELYQAILDGKARGVFNGKILVRKDAQKTDAKQTNRTLLLSDEATIDTKPQLEIFADDVKCTHGATVGQLDDDQLFYLRSRGLGMQEARDMLTQAFASQVIQRLPDEQLRSVIELLIGNRLSIASRRTVQP